MADTIVQPSVQRALKFSLDRLGYESLKPEQETVVREFLSGKDVFAALPTGYCKSLCYAYLPYAFDIASFPGPRPASRRLQYRTASDGKLGKGPGTWLLLTTERQRRIVIFSITPNVVEGRSESQVCPKRTVSTVCR